MGYPSGETFVLTYSAGTPTTAHHHEDGPMSGKYRPRTSRLPSLDSRRTWERRRLGKICLDSREVLTRRGNSLRLANSGHVGRLNPASRHGKGSASSTQTSGGSPKSPNWALGPSHTSPGSTASHRSLRCVLPSAVVTSPRSHAARRPDGLWQP